MAKKVYIGVDNKARKVKKIYFGVGDKARKVKKGYIGVGGVARPFWTGGEVAYYGVADPLGSAASMEPYGLTNSKYAMFTGGSVWSSGSNGVSKLTAYDASLTRTTGTGLGSYDGGKALVGDYCVFVGGRNGAGAASGITSAGCAINASLTKTSLTLSKSREYMGSASVGNYAIFCGGGHKGSGSTEAEYYTRIDFYNSSLTRTTGEADVESAYNGSYTDSYAILVDTDENCYAYDSALTKTKFMTLDSAAVSPTTTFAGYAVFSNSGSNNTNIKLFNNSLTLTTISNYVVKKHSFALVGSENNLLVAGGQTYSSGGGTNVQYTTNKVESYDKSLVVKSVTALSTARFECGSTLIGDYALIAGGREYTPDSNYNTTAVSTVDVYVI